MINFRSLGVSVAAAVTASSLILVTAGQAVKAETTPLGRSLNTPTVNAETSGAAVGETAAGETALPDIEKLLAEQEIPGLGFKESVPDSEWWQAGEPSPFGDEAIRDQVIEAAEDTSFLWKRAGSSRTTSGIDRLETDNFTQVTQGLSKDGRNVAVYLSNGSGIEEGREPNVLYTGPLYTKRGWVVASISNPLPVTPEREAHYLRTPIQQAREKLADAGILEMGYVETPVDRVGSWPQRGIVPKDRESLRTFISGIVNEGGNPGAFAYFLVNSTTKSPVIRVDSREGTVFSGESTKYGTWSITVSQIGLVRKISLSGKLTSGRTWMQETQVTSLGFRTAYPIPVKAASWEEFEAAVAGPFHRMTRIQVLVDAKVVAESAEMRTPSEPVSIRDIRLEARKYGAAYVNVGDGVCLYAETRRGVAAVAVTVTDGVVRVIAVKSKRGCSDLPQVNTSVEPVTPADPLASCERAPQPRPNTMRFNGPAHEMYLPWLWELETNCGEIEIKLFRDAAPMTVNSIEFLTRKGFYSKTRCHRLTTEGIYVLQCGDPAGNGTGGPGYVLPEENLPNATENNYPAGTVAMANAGPGTGGSQFFIVWRDTTLPSSYTVFGQLTKPSLKLVRAIAAAGTKDGGTDGEPKQPITIKKATTEKW